MNLGLLSFSWSPMSLNPHSKCISKQPNTIRSCLKSSDLQKDRRRSANYHPTIWDHRRIESLDSPYTYERFNNYLHELKQQVKCSLKSANQLVSQLHLIDAMQRLGVAYHFEEEIKEALHLIFSSKNYDCDNVYITALRFRLLRQNHYPIHSAELLEEFNGEGGRLVDARGLLSAYEASYLLVDGENIQEDAKKCTYKRLKSLKDQEINGQAIQVQRSLQTPLHWRMLRLEARNFIYLYEKDDNKNLVLLQLAKLDFNLVQSIHQRDLSDLSRWWRDLGFKETLPFSRDRLVENFIWATGIVYEPQFSKCRIGLTQFICILTAIDDIYDVHGSLDELEVFTEAVSSWNIKAMEKLPKYMQICYLAMLNFANKISYDILRDQGINVLPYIVKEWERLCKSYLVEARWFNDKYIPRLDEYLETAWKSVGGPAAMLHSYILQGETLTTGSLDCLKYEPRLVYWASVITRLNDDLGTCEAEMMRGDVPKSIQCYMNEVGVSVEESREHIKDLIRGSWKKLNEECAKTSLPKSIVNTALNMSRTGQCIFEHGDGIGTSDGVTKDRVVSLFIDPIEIKLT